MPKSTLSAYELDASEVRQLLIEAQRQLKAGGNPAERNIAGRLGVYEFDFLFTGTDFEMPLEETLRVIGAAVQGQGFLADQQETVDSMPDTNFYLGFPPEAMEWGRQFCVQVLKEIRSVVCDNSKEYRDLQKQFQSYPKAFAVAVSACLLNTCGLSSPMALGVATLLLLVLGQTTKNAFCKMTDQQVLAAIDAKIEQEQGKAAKGRAKQAKAQ